MANLVKRSKRINGHRTSIALEKEFWDHLERIAEARGLSNPALIGQIDNERNNNNNSHADEGEDEGCSLASAIRVFVLLNKIPDKPGD